jgi:hypothetical protein
VQFVTGKNAQKLFGKTDIRNDKSIRAKRKKLFGKGNRGRKLVAVKLCIEYDVGLDTVKTAIADCLFQFFFGKIIGIFSGVEAVRTEINGIRACRNGSRKGFGRAGRGKKFGFHTVFSFSDENTPKIFLSRENF